MHIESNQLSSAARIFKEMGELYEEEHDLKGAIEAYSQAADYFSAEDQVTTGNQCRLQVANLSALVEDYRRAIVIYEEVAAASLDNKLLQWSAKTYYFQAILCHFALSVSGGLHTSTADDAIKQYKNLYPALESSREYKFCEQLLEAISQADLEKFEDALYEVIDDCSNMIVCCSNVFKNTVR
jgi:alpha-soluble NSF attachment protein